MVAGEVINAQRFAEQELAGHLMELAASHDWLARSLFRPGTVAPDWRRWREVAEKLELAWERLQEGEPRLALEAMKDIVW